MSQLSAWGGLTKDQHTVTVLRDRPTVGSILASRLPGLPYGNGRSYGDVCLNPNGNIWHTVSLDKLISFDDNSGRLVCEAGVLLKDIQRMLVPRGWMLPVTPGTQLITVGGAIANDVHGKNHHSFGSFGDHVVSISLARSNGETLRLDWECTPDLLSATIGGMGLTGVIVTAELQLRRVDNPWLITEITPFRGLDEFFGLADVSQHDWEYTVSWIDCLAGKTARGVFTSAKHLTAAEANARPSLEVELRRQQQKTLSKPLKMPFVPPFSLVGPLSLKAFNFAYYQFQRFKSGGSVTHYEPFFHPLDNVQDWNRMYGSRGFYQYQSVVPLESGLRATQAILDAVAFSGEGSFLAVLKTFGRREAKGMMSFPQQGVTLALDFPNRGEQTLKLFSRLDAIVRQAGGRLYMAKDARMTRGMFEAGYPRAAEFSAHRDPGIGSAMSRRLMGY